MTRYLLTLGAALSLLMSEAQPLRTPSPSPTQTLTQEFGISNVELSYSRPGKKGRKVFGDLVPFGQVWRTGANSATTISFGDDVQIGEVKVPAGKYGLLTIPDKDSWTFIITRQLDVTNPAHYDPQQDVVRVQARPWALREPVETFTMEFTDVKPGSCNLQLQWENTAVALPISTDIDTKVMAQINQAMNVDSKPYFQAAMYYMESGRDLNQALVWFDKAAQQQPDAYWVQHQRANCLARLGRKEEARAAAQKSRELAVKAQNDDYVRLNDKLLQQLK
ncbi:MAG TPA: DUF2911 domain-containing protein [Chitinophagaceae bacterium]|nr:DUF2911 domain-containing protein [Chitinophagaceae bacterium]